MVELDKKHTYILSSQKVHNKVVYEFINNLKSRQVPPNGPHAVVTAPLGQWKSPPGRVMQGSEQFQKFQDPHFTTHL